jgi:hypothetical protein
MLSLSEEGIVVCTHFSYNLLYFYSPFSSLGSTRTPGLLTNTQRMVVLGQNPWHHFLNVRITHSVDVHYKINDIEQYRRQT